MTLQEALDALPSALLERIGARGFDSARLLAWARDMHLGQDARNVLQGALAPVPFDGLWNMPPSDSDEYRWLERIGQESIGRGELAVCVLAGGMATRMGGVVKALVELAPSFTFLDMVLGERERLRKDYGRAPALWLMTSEPTNGPVQAALEKRGNPPNVHTFEQFVSLRLAEDGSLFTDDDGAPSVYATGHGDLPDALRASGLLQRFIEGGGRYVWIANLDNLGARVDPALLGQHIEQATPLTVEVVDKHDGDKGGGPVRFNDRAIIAEHFRLPGDFDNDAVPVFNTNTFLVDAHHLASFELDWTYVEVRKNVKSASGELAAVQFERLLGEMTMAIPTRMQRVSRAPGESRFLAMKTVADMEREKPAIDALRARLTAD